MAGIVKRIKDFPRYMIGSDGTVWSNRRKGRNCNLTSPWYQIKGARDGAGRPFVHIRKDAGGKTFNRHICRLVLEAFIGPPSPGHECCHNDGDAAHNHLSNLRWDTHLANMADRERHGTVPRGLDSPKAKLSNDDVRDILRRFSSGERQFEIAKQYGVTRNCVHELVRRKTRTYIEAPV